MSHPHLTDLKSSAISGHHYDPATKVLHLRFTSGGVHRYEGVSPATVEKFLASESKGKFFHIHIRGRHTDSKVAG